MSASKRSIGSDLAKVDAHVLTEADYREIPELTEEDFARGVRFLNGVPAGGHPTSERAAAAVVTLHIDPETLAAYQALGTDWETAVNDDLRLAAERRKAAR
jgi:uncharacterized protein (DUF4415 family)